MCDELLHQTVIQVSFHYGSNLLAIQWRPFSDTTNILKGWEVNGILADSKTIDRSSPVKAILWSTSHREYRTASGQVITHCSTIALIYVFTFFYAYTEKSSL
jgi:hypothetical protein